MIYGRTEASTVHHMSDERVVEVRHTNAFDQEIVDQFLHFVPGVNECIIGTHRITFGTVDYVQVQIGDIEISEGRHKGVFDQLRLVERLRVDHLSNQINVLAVFGEYIFVVIEK